MHGHMIEKNVSLIFVDFDAEVFWRHLFGFTYFVKPNDCVRF